MYRKCSGCHLHAHWRLEDHLEPKDNDEIKFYIGHRRYDFLRSSKLINDPSLSDVKDFEGSQAAQNLVATGSELNFVGIELLPLCVSIVSEALLCINIIDRHPLIDGAHRQLVALLIYLDVDTAKHFLGLYLEPLLRLVQSVSHFLAHEV